MRYCVGLVLTLALGVVPLAGCSSETGGSGGSAGIIGGAVEELCERLHEECGVPIPLIGNGWDCADQIYLCLDANFPTDPLKQEWAMPVYDCLELSTCDLFLDCYLYDVPVC